MRMRKFRGEGAMKEGRCTVLGCKGVAKLGRFCRRHTNQYSDQGAAGVGSVDRRLKRLYVDAVYRRLGPQPRGPAKVGHKRQVVTDILNELQALLDTLPAAIDWRRLRGASSKTRAQQVLRGIVTQRGTKAAKEILAAAAGTRVCPKLHSSKRYRVSQVARSVTQLLRSREVMGILGRPIRITLRCRGWYAKQELVKMIEPVFDLWLRDGVQKSIELEVAEASRARRLALAGVRTETRTEKRTETREARVGTPVDPSCASCREHGWRFACAKHNTAEEWESRWR